MAIVAAEGYTWSDQEHIAKGRQDTDRTDRTGVEV
jgi:hypothetical protein